MGATLTTVDALTKEVYGPRIVDQMENETVLTKRIEKTSRGTESQVGGKYVTFPLKVRRNHGIGYRAELQQLQAAGQQGWTNVRVPLKYGYGRVHLSGQTIDLVSENYQAFSRAITEEMDGLKNDLQKDVNRILWSDGSGVLATTTTATAAGTTVNTFTATDVNWLDLDMQVDIVQPSGPTVVASNRKITAINETTGDVTLDGAAFSTASGDILVRTGNYGLEPEGLASLVEDTTSTLFNLSPASEPLWKANVTTGVGSLTESDMITMADTLRKKGGRPSVIFSDLGSRRAYYNLLSTNRRYTNTKNFEGGFSGLAFTYEDDIPVVTDVDAPAGKMWFLKEDTFKIYQHKDWHWEDKGGSIWNWVSDYDAFEALIKKYWEFAIDRRNVNGLLSGITAG